MTETIAQYQPSKSLRGPKVTNPPTLSHEQALAKATSRTGQIEALETFLRSQTDWLAAPASTRFHLSEPGGLLRHSLNVVQVMLTLREALAPEISEESCVIVGLYHDAGKAGAAGQPYYLPNPDKWASVHRGIRYLVNPNLVHLDVPTRSLLYLSRAVELSDEEVQAVRYHDGQYAEQNRTVAHRECALSLLLQYADNWSGCHLERTAFPAK